MYTAKVIPSEHKDLIHDVSFDFYGRRMATCSSDQSVKVWYNRTLFSLNSAFGGGFRCNEIGLFTLL